MPSAANSDLEMIFEGDEGCSVALWKNVLLTIVTRGLRSEFLAGVREGQRKLRGRKMEAGVVGGLTVIHSIELSSLDVSEDMRAELGRMMNVPGLDGHASIAIESNGFVAAAVRALLSAVVLVARPQSPQKFFGHRAEAAEYLSRHAAFGWTARELVAVANELTPSREELSRS